ncbi:hypothetical protein, partial [Novosphingobium sp. AP12]|uniref:hypothetical protein n=1 Tax=Novosphingobium sp. AP12 TaxID=1144305 RepID=UPI0002721F4E
PNGCNWWIEDCQLRGLIGICIYDSASSMDTISTKIQATTIDFGVCLIWFTFTAFLVSVTYTANLKFGSETTLITSCSVVEEILKFSAFIFFRKRAFKIVVSYGIFEAVFMKVPIFEWNSVGALSLYAGFAFASVTFHASTALIYKAAISSCDKQLVCGVVLVTTLLHVAYNMVAYWIINELYALLFCSTVPLVIVVINYFIKRSQFTGPLVEETV